MAAFQDTFAPLHNRNLRIYLTGQAVSLIGTWMQMTAQAWVVWQISGSEAALGIVGMLATIPFLLLGPLAGVWADRYDRRKILIYTQSLAMLLAFVLAGLVQFQLVQLWHVYVLATLLGCVSALDLPSQQAFVGDMVGQDMVRQAVVVNSMIVQISRILGPTLAGWVVKALGAGPAFFVNGISFIAVIASLAVLRVDRGRQAGGLPGGGGFVESLRYTMANPRILDLMIFSGLVTFFGFSNSQILPAFVDITLHGDAGLFGTLGGFSGAGALISVLFIVPRSQQVRRAGVLISTTLVISGCFYVLFSLTTSVSAALAAFFFAGMPIPLILTTNNGLLQMLAPNEMRARLLTLYLMFSFGLQPIANLWVGWLAQHLGTPMTIRINGIAMLTIALLMLLRRGLIAWVPAGAGERPANRA